MNTNKVVKALAIAAAVAFVTAPVTSTFSLAKTEEVKCFGVNTCKGHGECKTALNACKGQNECKGKGFITESAKKCSEKGGTTTEPTAS